MIESLGRCGAERLLVDVARKIDRRRFELRVYTLYPHPRDYAQTLRDLGIEERCLGIARLHGGLLGAVRLRPLLRKDAIDLVHTHLFGAHVVGRLAARSCGIPVVSTAHDADYEDVVRAGNPGLTPRKQNLLRLVDQCLFHATRAHLVAVSKYVAQSMQVKLSIPTERVTIIYNAVDVDTFRPRSAEKRRFVRESFGFAEQVPLVLCVGRMTSQKGQATLLQAMEHVKQNRISMKLVLIGDGASRKDYESLARARGLEDDVLFLGVRADVPDLLAAADLLVLPSLHEGFGLVLAEALATEVPVIASKTGPIPEIVRDQKTGLLFTPGDPIELALALRTLLNDAERRRVMGRLGREDVCSHFKLSTMVSHIEAFYERFARRADSDNSRFSDD